MGFDIAFFAAAVPAVLLAGLSKGGFGNGAGFAATAILAIAASPGVALGTMLPLLMLMDVAAVRSYWRGWDGPAARVLILGAVPGIALGGLVYRQVEPALFGLLIGVMALAFVAFQGARRLNLIRIAPGAFSARKGVVAGFAAGFTSFVSHAGGPPVAVFLLSQRLDKTRYQATSVIVFWAINLIKLVPYVFLGVFSAETLTAGALLAPVALLGVWAGVWLHKRMPERYFFALTYLLLLLTGGKLILDALG